MSIYMGLDGTLTSMYITFSGRYSSVIRAVGSPLSYFALNYSLGRI